MKNIKIGKLAKYSLFILVLLFAVFSCGKKENEKANANTETKVNDKSGKKYDRIVVLDPAVIEMVYLLGGEELPDWKILKSGLKKKQKNLKVSEHL